ncbi:putative auxin response factor 14 [Prosopis cineraria]|uniref:putative auxin response factor 14 n=1 Tax=Prosopis cineraria TaxID=364024 RepID=UPI00240FE76A|nr:putative auxin response factor 14 [Prosopis cineraria]
MSITQGLRKEDLYKEIWKLCARPLVDIPQKGERFLYFPQGHIDFGHSAFGTTNAEPKIDEVYARITLLPNLEDMTQKTPTQEVVVRDLHGFEWKFRHIYKGHYVHLGVLAPTSHSVITGTIFIVHYKPRIGQFIIRLNKYLEAVNNKFYASMRFKMRFEGENLLEIWYSSTIVAVEDFSQDWPNSKWRSLKVQWDELATIPRPQRVSPWEIEPFVAPVAINISCSTTTKNIRFKHVNIPSFEITSDSIASPIINTTNSSRMRVDGIWPDFDLHSASSPFCLPKTSPLVRLFLSFNFPPQVSSQGFSRRTKKIYILPGRDPE